jgi:flagellar biosynthesis protein FlhB
MPKEDVFDRIGEFFTKTPKYFGVFIIVVGIFMLAASIFNWNWVFSGHSFNLKKIEGITNMFGRGFARILFGLGGLLCIVLGIIWILVAKK